MTELASVGGDVIHFTTFRTVVRCFAIEAPKKFRASFGFVLLHVLIGLFSSRHFDIIAHIFPRFAPLVCNCFAFLLIKFIIFNLCFSNCPKIMASV